MIDRHLLINLLIHLGEEKNWKAFFISCSKKINITGIWRGVYGAHGEEVLKIIHNGYSITSTKLQGNNTIIILYYNTEFKITSIFYITCDTSFTSILHLIQSLVYFYTTFTLIGDVNVPSGVNNFEGRVNYKIIILFYSILFYSILSILSYFTSLFMIFRFSLFKVSNTFLLLNEIIRHFIYFPFQDNT
jgi:hypothetical protein